MNLLKLVLILSASLFSVFPANAAEKRYIFDIRNQSLSQALQRYARMTSIQMVYISKIAHNIKAPNLIGIYEAPEALSILLAESSLKVVYVNKNTLIVRSDRQIDDAEIEEMGFGDISENMDESDAFSGDEATGADRYHIMEEIITTGQLVKHPGFKSSSPSIALNYGDYATSGDLTNDEILNILPQIIPHSTPNTNNTGSNDGSSTVNLRNFGPSRTLVLLNGRRLPAANTDGNADISMIPSLFIDRIDIVTGGASAIYGSGAMAGVVNFIHKDHIAGFNVKSQFGISEYGDGEQGGFGVSYGEAFAGGRGQFSVYAGYDERGGYTEYDRAISRKNAHVSDGEIVETGTNTIPGGRYTHSGSGKYVSPSAIDPALLSWFQENFKTRENGDIYVNRLIRFSKEGKPLPFVYDDHNLILSEYSFLQNPYRRASLFGFGDYQLKENMTFFTELSYVYSHHERQLSPYPLRDLYISKNHPAITEEFAELLRLLGGGTTDNRIKIRTRIPEGGARKLSQNRHYGRIVAGIKGYFMSDWNFQAYVNYGMLRRERTYKNGYSRTNIQSALGCPVSSDDDDFYPDDCPLVPVYPDNVRINPFGSGNITAEQIKFIQGPPLISHIDTDHFSAAANLDGTVGNFFNDLPILLAGGIEYRYEEATHLVDSRLKTGDMLGFNKNADYRGSFDVWEIFGEVGIPLIADQPLFHKLDYTGGIRLSSYSSVGSVMAWRSGLSWEPMKGIRFRGEYQRAVRAPNIQELYQESGEGFPVYRDPCVNATGETEIFCNQLGIPDVNDLISGQYQVSSFRKGNLDLEAEISNTYTVGMIWRPDFMPNLVMSIDYYDISIDNVIASPSPSSVAQLCVESRDVNNIHCRVITRDEDGDVVRIDRQYENLVKKIRSGIDIEINYGLKLEELGFATNKGTIDFRFMGGWMLTSKEQTAKNSPLFDCAGFVDSALCGRALPKFKSVFWLSYKNRLWNINLRWRYLSGVKDGLLLDNPDGRPVIPAIPAFHYFDLLGSYHLSRNLSFYGGIRNIFNKQPPLIESDVGAGTDPATYDTRGRYYFLGINKSF